MPRRSSIARPFNSSSLLDLVPKQAKRGDALNLETIAEEFWQDIQANGINYQGDPIEFLPWYEHYCKFVAELRIGETYTTGGSQIGKTLIHTNFQSFCLVRKKLNVIWTYAGQTTLNKLVPQQFRPLIRFYLKNQGLTEGRRGKKTNSLYQHGEANASFQYVGVNVHAGQGLAAAKGSNVGESADIVFFEERSQYPVGSEDPIRSRLNKSRIATKPVRQLGTPGAGLGIEAEIDRADYNFHPFTVCPHCGEEVELNPKGCLLKSFERVLPNGDRKTGYLSATGKPAIANEIARWFHRDPARPVETAYIACPSCEGELTHESRRNAYFKCVKTGELLSDFLRSIGDRWREKRIKAGLWISPLLRITDYNLAADIIESGLDTENPANWCQQSLGLPSEASETSVTLEMIRSAINAPAPDWQPDFTVAGIDQGRHSHFLAVFDVYLPPGWQTIRKFNELRDKTIKVVRFGGSIYAGELIDRLNYYNCDLTIIDHAPNISEAARLANDCPRKIELARQLAGQLKEYQPTEVHDGGEVFPCWSMRSEKYQRLILDSFLLAGPDGFPLYRLPTEWEMWFAKRSESSPIRHLTSPSYDPSLGKWIRARDKNDDIWFAFHFAELAIDLYLKEFNQALTIAAAYGEI